MSSYTYGSKFHLISLTIILSLFISSNCYLIGVDLGSEFFKATMLKPKQPFTMVENIQSKTKTPMAISFKEDERNFGADALAKKPKLPHSVITFFNHYLEDKPHIKSHIENAFIAYDLLDEQDRHTVEFKINFDKSEFNLQIEEVYGMLFRYVKFLADKFSNSEIKDLVVTVPNHFDYVQRRRIVQAVEMSKLNLLSLVSENVAAAVQFSQNKQFNSTDYYIFYNMGSTYTQAALVSFTSNFVTKNNKTTEVSKTLKVVDEAWENNIAGSVMDYNLVRLLMEKFDMQENRKGKKSVKGDYKVAERILPSATKYKEILSANKEVPVSILGVESGMNIQTRLTRGEFETANAEAFEKAFNPVERIINRLNETTGLGWENITAMELLGGAVRVPKVQEKLKEKMGEFSNRLGMHMNGDDAMAFGAAFICANFSTMFKQPVKTELYHGPNYEIKIKLKNIPGVEICDPNDLNEVNEKNCHNKLEKNTTLYKLRTGLDVARTVGFRFDNDLIVELSEKFEEGEEIKILTYKVTGVNKALDSMKADGLFDNINNNDNNGNNTSPVLPKVNLRFKQDFKGQISLKADATYDTTTYLSLNTGPTGGQEVIYISNYTAPLPEEEIKAFEVSLKDKNMTESAKKVLIKMRRDVGNKQTRENKIELGISIEEHLVKPLDADQMKEAKIKLDKFDEIDRNRIKTMETRNALESKIYAKTEWLDSDKSKMYAKDAEELKTVIDVLESISAWYEDEALSAVYETLDAKLKEVTVLFKTFESRERTNTKRETAIDKFEKEFKKFSEEAKNFTAARPWVENYYNATFLKEFKAISNWFSEAKANQEKIALYEEAVLTAEQIADKMKILKREFFALKAVPKPKPVIPEENIKFDDMMKNKTNLEELMVSQLISLNLIKNRKVVFN